MLAYRFEYRVGADDVRFYERPRISKAIVVMALSRKMNYDIGFTDQFIHELAITDVARYKVNAVENAAEVVRVAGVGQLVDNSQFVLRPL